ncbi:MAG: condensation domain-containing protein [Methylococcaceae bacterium]
MSTNTTPSSFWKAVRNNVKLQRKTPAIFPANRSQVLPLSLGQQRLWQLEQLHVHNTVHNLRAAFRLQGDLDAAVLEKSLQAIVQRHEILRTEFPARGSQASQFILPELPLNLPLISLEHLSAAKQEQAVIDYAREETQAPFSLEYAPLLRVKLLRLSATEHVLLRTTHHIVYDMWSDSVFMRELAVLYRDFLQDQPSSLPALPIQYADFAAFQQQHLDTQALLTYWQQQLAGQLPLLQLPVDRIANFGYHGETEYYALSPELTQKLTQFATQQGTSLFVVLLTAFNVLLYQYSQQEDMLLCSPVAGRYQVETKKLIGFFNNLLLLRSDLSNDPSFSELLARIGQVTLDATTHQDLPLQALSDSLNIPANLLSRTMFTLQNVPSMPQKMADVAITRLDIEEGIANFDLSLSIREKDNGLITIARYKAELFDRSSIQQLLTRFATVLTQLVEAPQTRLSQLPRFAYQQIAAAQATAYIAPVTELEKTIAQVWQEVLQTQQIGLYDDFFSVGGSSLAMLQVSTQLEKRLNRSCAIVELFKQPTVSAMATYLANSEHTPETSLDIDAVKQRADRRRNALSQQKQLKTRRVHHD